MCKLYEILVALTEDVYTDFSQLRRRPSERFLKAAGLVCEQITADIHWDLQPPGAPYTQKVGNVTVSACPIQRGDMIIVVIIGYSVDGNWDPDGGEGIDDLAFAFRHTIASANAIAIGRSISFRQIFGPKIPTFDGLFASLRTLNILSAQIATRTRTSFNNCTHRINNAGSAVGRIIMSQAAPVLFKKYLSHALPKNGAQYYSGLSLPKNETWRKITSRDLKAHSMSDELCSIEAFGAPKSKLFGFCSAGRLQSHLLRCNTYLPRTADKFMSGRAPDLNIHPPTNPLPHSYMTHESHRASGSANTKPAASIERCR